MTRTIGRILCAVLLFALCGGHWAVMQVCAWKSMAADSGQSILQAAFDDPCERCFAIQEGRGQEKDDVDFAGSGKGPELALHSASPIVIAPPELLFHLSDTVDPLDDRRQPPAKAPPRSA